MTKEQAMKLFHEAAAAVHQAGYIVSGEVSFIMPRTPGYVETVASETYGEVNRITFSTRSKGTGGSLSANQPVTPNKPLEGKKGLGLLGNYTKENDREAIMPLATGGVISKEVASQGLSKGWEHPVSIVPLTKPAPVKNTGEVCSYCGGLDFVRKGSCLYCTSCGESLSGCS